MQQPTTTLILPLLLLSMMACRKTSNNNSAAPAKFTGCRIVQITEIGVDTSQKSIYTFTYNSDGTVASISLGSVPASSDATVKTFKYYPSSIVISLLDNNYPYSKDSLQLDAQNRVVRADHWGDNEAPSPNIVYEQYQYDSLGNMVALTSHSYNTVTSTLYQWKNGDIVWNTSGTDYYTYVYGATLYNTGNTKALLSDFENYGHAIYTPVHLSALAILDNADTIAYTYTLDTGGRFTQMKITEPGNYVSTKLISYQCE